MWKNEKVWECGKGGKTIKLWVSFELLIDLSNGQAWISYNTGQEFAYAKNNEKMGI